MFIIYGIYNFVSWPLTPLALLIPLTVSLSVVEVVHLVAEGRKCRVFCTGLHFNFLIESPPWGFVFCSAREQPLAPAALAFPAVFSALATARRPDP